MSILLNGPCTHDSVLILGERGRGEEGGRGGEGGRIRVRRGRRAGEEGKEGGRGGRERRGRREGVEGNRTARQLTIKAADKAVFYSQLSLGPVHLLRCAGNMLWLSPS